MLAGILSPTAPEKPQNITGAFVNSTSISVSWAPPPDDGHNGIIRRYIIRYSQVDRSGSATVSTTDLSVVIGGLDEYTLYEVNVSAVTVEEGQSNTVLVRTDSDGEL